MHSIAPTLNVGKLHPIVATTATLPSDLETLLTENRLLRQQNAHLSNKVTQLESVIFAKDCKASDRLVLASAYMHIYDVDKPDIANGSFATAPVSGEALAKQLGLSKPTVYNALSKWESTGVLQRRQEKVIKDQNGKTLDPANIPPSQRDQVHWESISYITASLQPVAIPTPVSTPYETKARDKAKVQSDLVRIAKQLQTIACPECGVKGELEITCRACGNKVTPTDIDIETTTPNINVEPVIEPSQASAQTNQPRITPELEVLSLNDNADRTFNNSASLRGGEATVGAKVIADVTLTPAISTPEAPINAPLSDIGLAVIQKFMAEGAKFSLVPPKSKVALAKDYLVNPPALATVLKHLHSGGNVGLLTGVGGAGIVAIDIDRGLDHFLQTYPEFALLPRSIRRNAPDRGKVFIRVAVGQSKHCVFESLERKAEFIGDKHHVIIAGVHTSGAVLELINFDGVIPLLNVEEVLVKLEAWTGVKRDKPSRVLEPVLQQQQLTSPVPMVKTAKPVSDMRKAAIDWWNANPVNQRLVEQLVANSKQSGRYVAIRDNDDTPSTRADCDGFYKRTWTDWGKSEKLDDFELYCRLVGKNKRAFMWDVIGEWREATGLPPLKKAK